MPLMSPPPWIVATGALKPATSKPPSVKSLKRPSGWHPTIINLLAPAWQRSVLWDHLAHVLAALLRAAASLIPISSTFFNRFRPTLRSIPRPRSQLGTPTTERSLALLLHNAPTFSRGQWEHLISATTLAALPDVLWQPQGRRSGVDIALCPAHPPEQLHKVRGEGHIAAPAAAVLALVEGVHTVAQWEPAYRDGHVLCDSTDDASNIRTQLLWSRHAAGPFVSDRDFVVRQTRMQLPCGTYVVHTVSDNEAEGVEIVGHDRRRGCVRAVLGDCGWVVRPVDARSCHATYIAQVDPKGSIPAWLVNQFASSMPMAIQRVRAVAERQAARAAVNAEQLASHPIDDGSAH